MGCPTRNPKSTVLRDCLCDESAAKYMLGSHDVNTLLGTIKFLDAQLADCEAALAECQHQLCCKKSD